jgi:hypothetical protein
MVKEWRIEIGQVGFMNVEPDEWMSGRGRVRGHQFMSADAPSVCVYL